jgi:hypothetical protein
MVPGVVTMNYRYPILTDAMACPFCYGWKILHNRSLDEYIRELKKRKVVLINSLDIIPEGWEGFVYIQPLPTSPPEPLIEMIQTAANSADIDYSTIAVWKKKAMLLWFLEPVV